MDGGQARLWIDAAADVVQIVAIAVGGVWTYWKFFRGRTFHRRGQLTVDARLHTFSGEPALVVRLAFTNAGLSKVDLTSPPNVLVTRLTSGAWDDGPAVWSPPAPDDRAEEADGSPATPSRATRDELVAHTVTLLETQETVEPGETVVDEQVFVPPLADRGGLTVAYRLRAALMTRHGRRRRPMMWTAYTVVPAEALRPVAPTEPAPATESEA
ncbi:hypothetical protein CLV56_0332 [Mumia flava]|uniref:Uncharacterized protein n=1 Tax=Mumia flava TaxID=1348852 RepID=A0A0B2B3A2_9ACTN|nr:hypothetical protein [Mumia flava]PJJ56128.1 hypothetical protein CLV56_0332 [Mumia flava]